MMARETPLLPVEDAREMALFFVVAALCFLAALAGLTAKSTYGAAKSWTAEVEGELTVTLQGADRRGAEDARKLIEKVEGVRSAHVLTREEIDALLEPNFGSRGLPESLPVPQLVAVTADPAFRSMGTTLQRRLTEAGFNSAVDEHADWAGDVRRMLGIARLVAMTAVALLVSTAVAVIAFATHAALLARRDIVDVLHLSGARDRFIASLFERRFWLLGLRAGTVGALLALGAAAATIFAVKAHGARTGLLPELSLDLTDLMVLVFTPLVAGLAARLAARITVIRSLKAVM
ncbi:MAG: cell division protein FtsX [Hyphomonas sp.]|nr:cell division protein FtsX [Hyphomonas sp.]